MIADLTSPPKHIDLLRTIHSRIQNFTLLVGHRKHPISRPSPCTTLNFPVLHLPFPEDIILSINACSLPHNLLQSLQNSIIDKIHKLQILYTRSFEQTCQEIVNPSLSLQHLKKLQESYQTTYRDQHIRRIREDVSRYLTTLDTRGAALARKKPIFNTVSQFIFQETFSLTFTRNTHLFWKSTLGIMHIPLPLIA